MVFWRVGRIDRRREPASVGRTGARKGDRTDVPVAVTSNQPISRNLI
jgi:hypothetical protein